MNVTGPVSQDRDMNVKKKDYDQRFVWIIFIGIGIGSCICR